MRPTRTAIIIAVMSGGLLAAYLAVSAQEVRNLWKPPPLLPSEESEMPDIAASLPAAAKGVATEETAMIQQVVGVAVVPPGSNLPGNPQPPVLPAPPPGKPDQAAPPKAPKPSVNEPFPIAPKEIPMINLPGPAGLSIDGPGDLPMLPLIEPKEKEPVAVPPVAVPKEVTIPKSSGEPAVIPLPMTDASKTVIAKPLGGGKGPISAVPVLEAKKEIIITMPVVEPPPVVAPPPKEAPSPAFPEPPAVQPLPVVQQPPVVQPPPMVQPPPVMQPSPVEQPSPAIQPPPMMQPSPAPVAPPKETVSEPVKAFVRIRPPGKDASPVPNVMPSPSGLPKVEVKPAQNMTRQTADSAPPAAKDPNSVLVRRHTPELIMEKRGAAQLRSGETLLYQIVVRNLSNVPAQNVVVEDELPPGVQMIGGDPAPLMADNKAVWQLSQLDPRSERTLRFTLHAGAATEILNRTSVHVSAAHMIPDRVKLPALPGPGLRDESSSSIPIPAGVFEESAKTMQTGAVQPRVNSDALVVQLAGPPLVVVGKSAVFDIRVTNQSAEVMNGLRLYGFLPEGLDRPEGRKIEGIVDGLLRPGESKTLKMPTNVVKPGRHAVQVKVTTEAGHETVVQTTVDVGGDTLMVQSALTTRLFVGREGDYRIELTNPTDRMLRNVAVVNQLAEGVDFVAASDRGLYQANTRTVHWLIDNLLPGQSCALSMRVFAIKAGEHENLVTARADGLPETRVAGKLLVESISDLSLNVITRDNPVQLGQETVYEIQVLNPGSAPATNVQLQVQFPVGIAPRSAQGKTRFGGDRQTVVFEPLAVLGPKGKAVYRVSAQAQTVGDLRLRISASSDQVRQPITKEISTLVSKGN